MSKASYSFTEMRILLIDMGQYDAYRNSWWIRFKIRFIRIYRGGNADILMDIDALDGDVTEVFKEINDRYIYYTEQRNKSKLL